MPITAASARIRRRQSTPMQSADSNGTADNPKPFATSPGWPSLHLERETSLWQDRQVRCRGCNMNVIPFPRERSQRALAHRVEPPPALGGPTAGARVSREEEFE